MHMHMPCTHMHMHMPCMHMHMHMCQIALPGGTILVLTCGDPTGDKKRLLGSGSSSPATPGSQVCA